MNDFTKDELKIILDGLLWRDAHILPCDRPEKLKSKIQSMIDGYCEHEWKKCFADFEYDECTRCGECEL